MKKLEGLKPARVFEIFEEMCAIPHGSGDMEKISEWCVEFARARGLKCIKDDACNVVIFKNGARGYENSTPVILQGHLDMVCQKTEDSDHDFEKDGLDLFIDGDMLGAKNTTLGGDNGIGSAIILALLDSTDLPHPPLEAVFTTDEEIGMLGALRLDMSLLHGKHMINLDSEEPDVVTVSCAGGADIKIDVPVKRVHRSGECLKITLDGMKGGHSGVEINKNRVNASILMGRVLNHLGASINYGLVSLSGGDKTNAIVRSATAEIFLHNAETVKKELLEYLETVKSEIISAEPEFTYSVSVNKNENASLIADKTAELITFLATVPQGVATMSADIEGLVESSQNLGIMKTDEDKVTLIFSLRSSKISAMKWLEERLYALAKPLDAEISVSGIYPPWEYLAESKTRDIWCKCAEEISGAPVRVEAIHAGLECGVFASGIDGLDCISVGPELRGIHTVEERLKISSVEVLWKILTRTLEQMKD